MSGMSWSEQGRRGIRWGLARFVLACVVATAPLIVIFGPAVFTNQSFAYRDAAHFYFPQFYWETRHRDGWASPAWNPHSGIGQPYLADASTSVLYPGKAVFLLPLPYLAAYKLYVIGHACLAAAGGVWLARRLGTGYAAAALAGMSYAASGGVVFQHCNVVFLVGAAWTPFAVGLMLTATRTAGRWFSRRRLTASVWLGVVVALMTLGGDIQAGYHFALAAGLWLVIGGGWRCVCGPRRLLPLRRLIRRATPLFLAAVIASLLAAGQLAATLRWSQQSVRAQTDQPGSLYDWIGEIVRGQRSAGDPAGHATLLAMHDDPSHLAHRYYFSVGPWRWAELMWPVFGGRTFPISHRWMDAIPAEGRVWTPSLYFGLPAVVFGLVAARFCRGGRVRRFLTWLFALSLLASLGHYGVGWLIREIVYDCGGDPEVVPVGPAFGGFYWLLNCLAPAYSSFRYPAKWLVFVSLAGSQLGAIGFSGALRAMRAHGKNAGNGAAKTSLEPRPLCYARRWATSFALLSGVAIAAAVYATSVWWQWLATAGASAIFGPPDLYGAGFAIISAVTHGAIAAAVLRMLLSPGFVQRLPHGAGSPGMIVGWAWLVVGVAALDLAVAHHGLAPTTPTRDFFAGAALAKRLVEHDPPKDRWPLTRPLATPRAFREQPHPWTPFGWLVSRSEDRLTAVTRSNAASLHPKYHLLHDIGLVNDRSSVAPVDLATLLAVAQSRGKEAGAPEGVAHPVVLEALGVSHLILRADKDAGAIAPTIGRGNEDSVPTAAIQPSDTDNTDRKPAGIPPKVVPVSAVFSGASPRRAYVATNVIGMPPLTDIRWTASCHRAQHVLFPGGQPRDLAETAVVEVSSEHLEAAVRIAQDNAPQEPVGPAWSPPSDAHPQVADLRIDTVHISVDLKEPGLLVLADYYDDGWRAWVRSAPLSHEGAGDDSTLFSPPILRTNRVCRGVYLPAGRHTVVFQYRPPLKRWAVPLSGCAWLAVALYLGYTAVMSQAASRRRHPRPTKINAPV